MSEATPDDRVRLAFDLQTSLSNGVPADGGDDRAGRRFRSSGEFLRQVRPRFVDFGLTRVGSLTSLDTIGIPVWFAVRPNSRSLSLSQGKGLDDDQACISAVMESLEQAVAERPRRCVGAFETIAGMARRRLAIVPLAAMSRCADDRPDPTRERAWVPGVSLISGEPVFAPYELVGVDMRVDAPWDRDGFRMSSIGLASGATLAEAALHGLCEVVENDCTAPWQTLSASLPQRRLAFHAGADDALDQAVGKVAAAGLQPSFYDVSNDIGLPAVMCTIERTVLDDRGPGARRSAGVACHPDRLRAAVGAILEAVQTRLTYIAGARDDIDASEYQPAWRNRDVAPDTATADPRPIVGEPELRRDGPLALLRRALDALRRAGIPDVYLFPLGGEEIGINVVRVLVPTLEAGLEQGVVRIGSRGLAGLLNRAAAA
jgi:ribosomal protein S12 methylthiotransferase accessory factor